MEGRACPCLADLWSHMSSLEEYQGQYEGCRGIFSCFLQLFWAESRRKS